MDFYTLNSRAVLFGTLLSICHIKHTLKKNQVSLALKELSKNLNERKQTWHIHYFKIVR